MATGVSYEKNHLTGLWLNINQQHPGYWVKALLAFLNDIWKAIKLDQSCFWSMLMTR